MQKKIDLNFLARQFWLGSSGAAGAFIPDRKIGLGPGFCLVSHRALSGILEHLKWESIKKRRRAFRLILLYKGLKGKASIPTDDLIPLVMRCRNYHYMAYQVPVANTDIYKCSSPPPPPFIRDWNALPDSLIWDPWQKKCIHQIEMVEL